MTVQELLQLEPHLSADEARTGVYLIPIRKFGYTSFPVGTFTEKVADGGGR